MSKLRLLSGLLAAVFVGNVAAQLAPTTPSGFYVVVPLGPVRAAAAAEGIDVTLAGHALPRGLVGLPYDGFNFMNSLTVTGDAGYTGYGVKWEVLEGSIPAGLTLGADGKLTGTPTVDGTSQFKLRATYKTKSGETAYELVVGRIVIAIASGTPPQAIVGLPYSYDLKPLLNVSGDPSYAGAGVTWSTVSSTLPPGISLRTDGTISGTPSAGGTGTIVARASYRGSNGEQTFELVSLAVQVALASAAPHQAIVGQNYVYDLKSLLSVNGDGAYNGSGVTWTALSDNLPAGLSLRADGTIAGMPTASGSGFITVRATYRGVNDEQAYEVVTLSVNVVLGATTPPHAVVGQAYNYDLKPHLSVTGDNAYTGSGVTWTVVSSALPAGLYLRNDGAVVGTPTASGTGNIVARATYRGVNGQQTYEVVALGITVTLATGSPPQAIVGQSYSYDIKPLLSVSGDPAYNGSGITWTVVSNTLAPGLQLLNSGIIAGTPTGGGTGTLTARATYRGVSGDRAYQVVTLNITVSLAAATLPQARVGEPYSYDVKPRLTVSGDSAYNGSGVSWSTVSNSLPVGLSLTTAGSIAGTPSVSGTGSVTARATYRNVIGQQSYSVTALPAWAYGWTQNSWSTPAACGATTSTRSVWCLREDGATVADANCTAVKPVTTQPATDYSTCSYAWSSGSWNTPAACGSTTATRSVSCERSDGTTVADGSCTAAKPSTTLSTTDYSSCSYTWNYDSWSTPSSCGAVTQTRTVWCQRSDGTTVTDASCGGAKPATTNATTNYSSCTYSNSYGSWGSCSASCGGGTQYRSATCYRSDGTAVSAANCPAPNTSQSCNTQSCYSYSWSTGGWSTPAGCGTVTQSRSVSCQRSDGASVSDAYCGGGKPASTQSGTSYASCTYTFSYGGWGSCTASCGGGTQTRSATCYRSDGTPVANSSCGTPVTSQSCNTQACAPTYTYSYSYSGWSACSASCGGGTQTRTATCYRNDGQPVSGSYCGASASLSQSCNTQACAPTTGTWTTTWIANCQNFTSGSIQSGSCSPLGATNSGFARNGVCSTGNANFQQTCQ